MKLPEISQIQWGELFLWISSFLATDGFSVGANMNLGKLFPPDADHTTTIVACQLGFRESDATQHLPPYRSGDLSNETSD